MCSFAFYRSILLTGILTFLVVSYSNSQEIDCSSDYSIALQHYNSGQIISCLQYLQPCLQNRSYIDKTDINTRISLYRLAAHSSILLGRYDEAENYVKGLLSNDPYYKVSDNDFVEMNEIIRGLFSRPKHKIGIASGISIGEPIIEKIIDEFYEDLCSPNSPSMGVECFKDVPVNKVLLGINYEYLLMKRLSLISGIYWNRYELSLEFNYDNPPTHKFNFNAFDIPLLLKYSLRVKSKFNPYMITGINFKCGRTVKSAIYGPMLNSQYGKFGLLNLPYQGDVAISVEKIYGFYGNAGCGLSYRIRKSEIYFDSRVLFPFKLDEPIDDFGKISEDDPIYNADVIVNLRKGAHLQISVGYKHILSFEVFRK